MLGLDAQMTVSDDLDTVFQSKTKHPERPGSDLSVIIPTLNERDNIAILVQKLHDVLDGISWEVVFVDDDSTDGTNEAVMSIALTDPCVRLIHRIGRRGLSSACVEGALSSFAPVLAVMDADLQHDETVLPSMYASVASGKSDIAIGSRYIPGGGVGDWDPSRARMSDVATRLSRLVTKVRVADPMSGFFAIRRETMMSAVRNLSGQGFKILLDVIASSPGTPRISEHPYTFRSRIHGESKLDSMVAWEYLMLLADKMVGKYIPVRFIPFALIGVLGVATNLACLDMALYAGVGFAESASFATLVSMIGNFLLNNFITYRDRRLHGLRMLRGMLTFCLGCGLGAAANVGVASLIYAQYKGWVMSGLTGAVIGSVFNYAIASTFTWKNGSKK